MLTPQKNMRIAVLLDSLAHRLTIQAQATRDGSDRADLRELRDECLALATESRRAAQTAGIAPHAERNRDGSAL